MSLSIEIEPNYYPTQTYDDDRWQMRSYVTDEYIIYTIKSTLFYKLLKDNDSSFYDDRHIWDILNKRFSNRTYNFKYLTFRNIRKIPNWEKLCDDILKELLSDHKPFGSCRVFRNFKFQFLYINYVIRITREIWAQHTINKYLAPLWIERYYNPENGAGFVKLKRHFNDIASNSK